MPKRIIIQEKFPESPHGYTYINTLKSNQTFPTLVLDGNRVLSLVEDNPNEAVYKDKPIKISCVEEVKFCLDYANVANLQGSYSKPVISIFPIGHVAWPKAIKLSNKKFNYDSRRNLYYPAQDEVSLIEVKLQIGDKVITHCIEPLPDNSPPKFFTVGYTHITDGREYTGTTTFFRAGNGIYYPENIEIFSQKKASG